MTNEAARIATLKNLHEALRCNFAGDDFGTVNGVDAEWDTEEFSLYALALRSPLVDEVLVSVGHGGQSPLFTIGGRVEHVAFMVNKFLDSNNEDGRP